MRSNRPFWAIVLILVGLALLLDNLGVFTRLEISVWDLIWPLVVIAFGVWFLWGALFGPRAAAAQEASIPLEGATRAHVKINHGAGRLVMGAGATAGQLAAGSFGGGLDYRCRRDGDLLDVRMRPADAAAGRFFFPWNWGPGMLDWTVALNGQVPLALELETGASDTTLDLAELLVTELELKTGASSTRVTLPTRAGYTKVEIESGVASVDVRVPAGVAARVRARGGLASIDVDEARFPRRDGVRQSPDYDTAANKVDIEIETGVGSVSVR